MGQNKSESLTSVLNVVRSLRCEMFLAAHAEATSLLEMRTADAFEAK